MTSKFSHLLTALLNIKIVLEGERDRWVECGAMIVSNHLGYLDGIVLGSIFPVIYVSKKEVRGWPLIGQWTALVGTVYVDRTRRNKIPSLIEEIAKNLQQKTNVLIFPEGTSTNGERVLPFQSSFFAAPLSARAPVVPVTLTYKRVDGEPLSKSNRDRVCWYGDMEFVSHFWNLLALQSVEVSVRIHPKIETSSYQNISASRKQLSRTCHEIITGAADFVPQVERRAPRDRLRSVTLDSVRGED